MSPGRISKNKVNFQSKVKNLSFRQPVKACLRRASLASEGQVEGEEGEEKGGHEEFGGRGDG